MFVLHRQTQHASMEQSITVLVLLSKISLLFICVAGMYGFDSFEIDLICVFLYLQVPSLFQRD